MEKATHLKPQYVLLQTKRDRKQAADEADWFDILYHHCNGAIMNAEQAWQSVLGQLQMEMPRASFDTWVRDTKPVSYQDGTLTVGVGNAYARDWLENRLASTVNRLLVGIMNSTVDVNFIVIKLFSSTDKGIKFSFKSFFQCYF